VGSNEGNIGDRDENMENIHFTPQNNDSPFDESINIVNSWVPRYRNQKEALDELVAWAPSVMEYDPKQPAYDLLSWNSDWIDKGYLIVEDPVCWRD
jgi:deoxyribodipyrimidine photolyase